MAVKDGEAILDFRLVVKVICEEIDAALIFANDMSDVNDDAVDPMCLNWGGVDLCCPPFTTGHHTDDTSTVHENAQDEELNDPRQDKFYLLL